MLQTGQQLLPGFFIPVKIALSSSFAVFEESFTGMIFGNAV